jgi:hypothetical protein
MKRASNLLRPPVKVWQRRGQRGVVSIGALLEAAALLAWWTWVIVGEKHVADAVAARRSVDYASTDAALIANASRCGQARVPQPDTLAQYRASVSIDSLTRGKLEIGNLISLLAGVAIGGERTFEIYTRPFTNSQISAHGAAVVAPRLLGGDTVELSASRLTACVEATRDVPQGSMADYRKSVFSLIEGY